MRRSKSARRRSGIRRASAQPTAEFLQLAIEGRQPHTQPPGCLALVVATFAQYSLNVVRLVFADCLAQIIALRVDVRLDDQARWKIVGREYRSFAQDHRAFERVIELTHIADPGADINPRIVALSMPITRLPRLLECFAQQNRHELGNIFATIAQRRQMDGYDVQAIKEIGAKSVSGDLSREVFVGRREQPRFETKLPVSPLPATLPCFQSLARVLLESTGPARRFRQEKQSPAWLQQKFPRGRDPHR